MNPRYRTYHPKWHRERLPIFWWLRRLAYTRFITRELTSLAVGYSAVLLMAEAWAARRGGAAWAGLERWLGSAPVIAFHALVVVVLVYHTVTWLHLAPKALVVRVRGRRVPAAAIVAAHYGAWGAASALVVALVVGRG
jgi:fumarate reductase subunit C